MHSRLRQSSKSRGMFSRQRVEIVILIVSPDSYANVPSAYHLLRLQILGAAINGMRTMRLTLPWRRMRIRLRFTVLRSVVVLTEVMAKHRPTPCLN